MSDQIEDSVQDHNVNPDDNAPPAEDYVRVIEAIIFASQQPVSLAALHERLPENIDLDALIAQLQALYAHRGVHLVKVGEAYAFRTAPDLSFILSREQQSMRKLSRAALEVLAIIAYHQPVTRAELEEIRGVETSKGTLDVLLESGWIKLRGRRRTPGRPVTYGTTQEFLDHFSLSEIGDLPGLEELRGAGLLSTRLSTQFSIPTPSVRPDQLDADEDELEDIDLEQLGLLAPLSEDD